MMKRSLKRRKTLKPFMKNERLLQRLLTHVQELEERRKRSPVLAEACSDLKRKYEENEFVSENFINTSLRNVYVKGLQKSTDLSIQAPPVSESWRYDFSQIQGKSFEDIAKCDTSGVKSFEQSDSPKRQRLVVVPKKKVKLKNKTSNKSVGVLRQNNEIPRVFTVERPTVTLADVGGLDSMCKAILKEFVHVKHQAAFQTAGIRRPTRGILLSGPSGCGKTLVSKAIAGDLGMSFIEIKSAELLDGTPSLCRKKIKEIFDQGIASMPCILFFHGIDAMASKRAPSHSGSERQVLIHLLECIDELDEKDPAAQIMLIASSNDTESLDPALQKTNRFHKKFNIRIPNEDARLEILKIHCKNLSLAPDVNLKWLARNTPGYVGDDLKGLISDAAKNAAWRQDEERVRSGIHDEMELPKLTSWLKNSSPLENFVIEIQDLEAALCVYVPRVKHGFATVPDVTWCDIGALEDKKIALQKVVLWPIKYRQVLEKSHARIPSGILLCGPKGCGKTLLAKALANEGSINFLSIKGPELLNKYVGESERAIRECFKKAGDAAPCILFFDEIDAICPPRSSNNDNAAATRVVNQILCEMDGFEDRKGVFVIGTTNRPTNIDSALLRPGRLDKTIFIGVPNEQDRYDILCAITRNGTEPRLGSDVSLTNIAHDVRCEGFSGADLSCLVGEATIQALSDCIEENETPEEFSLVLKMKHFELAFAVVKPSISMKDMKYFKKMSVV